MKFCVVVSLLSPEVVCGLGGVEEVYTSILTSHNSAVLPGIHCVQSAPVKLSVQINCFDGQVHCYISDSEVENASVILSR